MTKLEPNYEDMDFKVDEDEADEKDDCTRERR